MPSMTINVPDVLSAIGMLMDVISGRATSYGLPDNSSSVNFAGIAASGNPIGVNVTTGGIDVRIQSQTMQHSCGAAEWTGHLGQNSGRMGFRRQPSITNAQSPTPITTWYDVPLAMLNAAQDTVHGGSVWFISAPSLTVLVIADLVNQCHYNTSIITYLGKYQRPVGVVGQPDFLFVLYG